jgi:hypothetical protein
MLQKNKKAVNTCGKKRGFNVTALVNVVGFALSAVLAVVFGGALHEGYVGGYELAVLLSLAVLSAFSTVLFGSMLVSEAAQIWRDYQRLAPAARGGSSNRQGVTHIAANVTSQSLPRPRLPQSPFARRWGNRQTRSYEQTYEESREQGEQQSYRLECRALIRRNLRLVGPNPRPTILPQRRKKRMDVKYWAKTG